MLVSSPQSLATWRLRMPPSFGSFVRMDWSAGPLVSPLRPYTFAAPPNSHQRDFLVVARLEAHGGSRGNIEPHAKGSGAVETQARLTSKK